jgi:hypothetical protein
MPFQPGQSGNPGGRPKETAEVRQLAREHTAEIIERLLFWVRSDNPRASVAACQALLDRGYGKPSQELEIDYPVRGMISDRPLTQEEWEAEVAAYLAGEANGRSGS